MITPRVSGVIIPLAVSVAMCYIGWWVPSLSMLLGRYEWIIEMDGTRKDPELSSLPINGHGLSEGSLGEPTATIMVSLPAAGTADREATRYLAAATQIDVEYARNVVDRVVNQPLKALAPTFGVDVPVVAKWAMKALRTRAIRDYLLTAAFAFQFFFLILLILWWDWGWTLILLLLIISLLVVSWDYHERIHKTVIRKMLRDRFNPEDAPAPLREDDGERLREITKRKDGNLVVFSDHAAFVGSGEAVYRRHLLLDISGEKKSDNGPAKQPDHFTSHDLHIALMAAFDRERGLAKNFNNIKVYERLFVNGLHIQNNKDLLPDRLKSPPTSVDSEVLRAAAINPSPEARTYVCVEMPGWQGQLVVTLFIRAVYAGSSLFVEWTFRVLPPISAKFLHIDDLYELPRYRQLRTSLAFGLHELIPALFKSPARAVRSWRRPRVMKRHQERLSYAIKRGYVFDYGADRSIREDASGSQRQHYFLARDETMYVLLAQQTLIRTVGDFLSEHGIDLGQFDDQVKVIFEQTINYNIGTIKDSTGIVIGDNSSATVGDSSKGAK